MERLIIFSDTFPYGTAESFLADELPYLAREFGSIEIIPLYSVSGEAPPLPHNVAISKPLLKCNHKSVSGLLKYGLLCTAPAGGIMPELFRKGAWHSPKRIRIILSYWLMMRSSLSNRELMEHILSAAELGTLLYFYWGDKSALILPYLRKWCKGRIKAVVRFHGSDVYEEAKGILPFRERLYKAVEWGVPVSDKAVGYIKERYKNQPQNFRVFHLGSKDCGMAPQPGTRQIRLVSCSNIIGLKRVGIIAKAVVELAARVAAEGQDGCSSIVWTHIGDGPLRAKVEELLAGAVADASLPDGFLKVRFTGALPHQQVLELYKEHGADLFLHASRSEGAPVSIMEAASFGIPVISTNVGAIDEMVDERWLLPLVEEDETVSLMVSKIVEYLSLSGEERSALRESLRRNWELNWNAEKNYSSFAGFLKGICNI